jgi:hypothetical protein
VIDTLAELFAMRGVPQHIRSENGPEFVAAAIRRPAVYGSFQHGGWLLREMGLETQNHFTSEPPPLQFLSHNFRSYLNSVSIAKLQLQA